MAKKTNYTPYILGAVAVGGFAAYRFGLFDKLLKKTSKAPEIPEIEPITPEPVVKKEVNTTPAPDPLKNPVYMNNVRKLQLYLGAGVDGNAGGEASQTNRLTQSKFPALYSKIGRVTPATVGAYLSEIDKKTTTDLSTKERNSRIAFGKKLVELGSKGKTIRPKSNLSNVSVMYYDTSRGQYVPSSRKTSVLKTYTLFSRWTVAAYTNDGYYILKSKSSPKDFVIVNPYSFEAI